MNTKPEIALRCAQCGKPVLFVEGKGFQRDCGHETASVLADLKATVYGEAKVK
jgi:hypothetical protein